MAYTSDKSGKPIVVEDLKGGFPDGAKGTDAGGNKGTSEGGFFVPDKN